MSKIVTISNLEKTYKTDSETLTILKDLHLEIEAGSKTVIVGESGSGKSTFLNIIGGLDTATSGSVRVGDYEISSLSEDELTEYRSRFLGLIFQFHYLLKDFTALENVFLPAYMAGCPKNEAREKAIALLHDVGLSGRMDHLPSQLSGGERQRVAVARSLINDPQIILADEPTGSLDEKNKKELSDLLLKLRKEYGQTILLVTHDKELAAIADRVIEIKDGAVR